MKGRSSLVRMLFVLPLLAVPGAIAQAPGEPVGPLAAAEPAAAPLHFAVTYDASITDSFSGRVYVMTHGNVDREPRFGPSWFGTQPFFARDVTDWRPGVPLVFDGGPHVLAFPAPVSLLEPGDYAVQAVMRRNLTSPDIGNAKGNAYGEKVILELDPDSSGPVDLRIDRIFEDEPRSIETERIKEVSVPSRRLSRFHGRPVSMRAAVVLPLDYDPDSDRRYPAYYWIGGFGSDHRSVVRMLPRWDATGHGADIIRIVLDPQCYGGHHAFADSANNGPVGQALVEELIPHLERAFPLVAAPTARFVSGHSSGGWSSLWLQVTYPDVFGGVWSLAPDPVDFRDFQRIDLYADGANMYRDAAGNPRPIARRGDDPVLWYEPFCRMEHVRGEGGQIRSFEWVFSPRDENGLPKPLYDRETGAVDPAVAKAWEAYDIRLVVERNWPAIGPKLGGKITIVAGELDTFYLEGAVIKLKSALEKLGSDATIEVVPGADHGSFATPDLRARIDSELLASFRAHHGEMKPQMDSDGH